MPDRIARPCRVRSCRHRTTLDHGYCEQHSDRQRVRPSDTSGGWRNGRQGSSSQRGYGHQWTRLRSQVLRRDGWLCRVCHQAGQFTRATCVDHIRPKSRGGDDALSNLQSLCDTCHRLKTQAESNDRPCCGQLAAALAAQGIQP
ncbi:HNH endonuclease [Endozoicomonas sp. SCSIO W0465]|uniref:HNH endonuclease n=1 Tax=Endozoicomonas sp. SCSIO W0465 TaxID=2918516 RepID=UPI002075620E|nr:HNH endonuclease [Endozoicomonas sp. SCSIO W0465]USE39223.1 HNH endonuclease [Endozoicomonas sp. SCSIO W0465]